MYGDRNDVASAAAAVGSIYNMECYFLLLEFPRVPKCRPSLKYLVLQLIEYTYLTYTKLKSTA